MIKIKMHIFNFYHLIFYSPYSFIFVVLSQVALINKHRVAKTKEAITFADGFLIGS